MGLFNTEAVGTKTVNLAGGEAYKTDPRFELVSILLTSFVQDQFYRKASDTVGQLVKLAPQVGWEFAAKAAVFARREFGMRSITHVIGGEVAKHAKGQAWTGQFFNSLFKRPDDMLEVTAYYAGKYGIHPLPNNLKRAIRKRLHQLKEYELAKYRGEGKAIKMIDLVNLTHPRGTSALEKLVKGTLRSTGTWETKLTQAGQQAETEEEKLELKANAWKEMLAGKKLGYLALLRNVRNILQQAPDCQDMLCDGLINREAIKKSLVFPFQIMKAVEEIKKLGSIPRPVLMALSTALDMSLDNCPRFDGKTLVVVDDSGSMMGKPIDIASIFAAVLYKTNDADLMLFDTTARYINLMPSDSVASLGVQIQQHLHGGGTDFKCIFNEIAKIRYERIIILSDMQGWVGYAAPTRELNSFVAKVGHRPYVYSFDLQGYGTLQFPENGVFCLAGFSDKIFDVMKLLEQDRHALINRIAGVTFS